MSPPPPPKIFQNEKIPKAYRCKSGTWSKFGKITGGYLVQSQHPSLKAVSAQTIKLFFLENTTPHILGFFLFPIKLILY